MSEPAGADDLVSRLLGLLSTGTPITVFIGSGVTDTAIPGIPGILALADVYAQDRPDGAGLVDALQRARRESPDDDVNTFLGYRRAFAAWVSGNEFDVVAQEAVLEAYRPLDPTLLKTRGRWQRVEAALGDRLEADVDNWFVPDGLAALGALIADRPQVFHGRLLTTNFDPLVEIAVMRTGVRGATSVPLTPDGTDHPIGPGEESVKVYHLHGFWRPDLESNDQRLLHDPDYLAQQRPALGARVAALIRSDVVLVLGHSGWDGVLEEAVRQLSAGGRRLTLLWAGYQQVQRLRETLTVRLADAWVPMHKRPVVEVFAGVDSNHLLPELARRLGVRVPRRRSSVRRRRHLRWERELISEPGVRPPDDAIALVRQLDRRYQWERSWTDPPPPQPTMLFWPVRLRPSPSVIHMAQAFAAAALSARGAEVIACLDDYNVEDKEKCADRFRREVERWFDDVPGSNRPEFASLEDFIERPEDPVMPRDARPWEVAREAFGESNPSVLSILIAAKIIREQPSDRSTDAAAIVRELSSQPARRLLTPLTLWSHLNYLIANRLPPTGSVMTLGGREEKGLWDLWREIYDHGVHQLYNPQIHNLNNQSLMLRWTEPDQLRSYLAKELDRPGWDQPGRYFYWLVQNAFLLPTYVTEGAPPTVDSHRLDSWAAVHEVMRTDRSVVDVVVDRVCAVYLR